MSQCSEQETKPKIHLSLSQVGIIILYKSGVIYQNQTCNAACRRRCEEGVLLLPSDTELVLNAPVEVYQCPIESKLRIMDWGPIRGIDQNRASEIDALLKNYPWTKYISVDQTHLLESEEAWVYVNIEQTDVVALYSGFGACRGVLVWANSD